jgi:hypothetical protein
MFGTTAILMIFLYIILKFAQLKRKRTPFTHDFLRSPGHTLLKRLDALNQEISIYLLYLISLPICIYAAHISLLYFSKMEMDTRGIITLAIICTIMMAYFLFQLLRFLRKRKILRLDYEGQLAVAEELNQLMKEGYHVYHDLAVDEYNIDHLVIGHSGVFAIETNAQSKPTSRGRVEDATVSYDGRVLYFPKGEDWKTLDQAKQQADWLSEWIHRTVGKPIAVRAIVALPGWYVKRTSADGISVINPKQFSALFKYIKPRHLPQEMIGRIVHQIEQKFRNVEPTSEDFNGE